MPRVTSRRALSRLSLLAACALVATLLTGCGSDDTTTPRAKAKGQCTYDTDTAAPVAKKVDPPRSELPEDLPTELTLSTNQGDVTISLDTKEAPCTVNSFVSLARQQYFDGSHCHRLVTQGLFVLQCGDPSATGKPGDPKGGTGGPGYTFGDELVEKDPRLQPCTGQVEPQSGKEVCTYTAGTVAMANSGADTNGSQFFLVYKDSQLPNGFTVFGTMSAAGVKVVQNIAAAGAYPPNANGNTAPKTEVLISSVK